MMKLLIVRHALDFKGLCEKWLYVISILQGFCLHILDVFKKNGIAIQPQSWPGLNGGTFCLARSAKGRGVKRGRAAGPLGGAKHRSKSGVTTPHILR